MDLSRDCGKELRVEVSGVKSEVRKNVCLRNYRMSEGDHGWMKLWEWLETKSSRVLPVLQKVQLEILADEGELEQLRLALSTMGCAELVDMPWRVGEEGLIRDLIGPMINT